MFVRIKSASGCRGAGFDREGVSDGQQIAVASGTPRCPPDTQTNTGLPATLLLFLLHQTHDWKVDRTRRQPLSAHGQRVVGLLAARVAGQISSACSVGHAVFLYHSDRSWDNITQPTYPTALQPRSTISPTRYCRIL